MSLFMLLTAGSAIVVLAAWSQGVSGFGFALISFPLLLVITDVTTAIILSQFLALTSSVRVGWHDRRHIMGIELAIMLICSLPFAWLGTYLLLLVPSWGIQVVAGSIACMCAGLLAVGVRHVFRHERGAVAVAGTLGGVLQGCTGMGGPPVVLLLANQGWTPRAFRSSLSVLFGVNATVTIIAVSVQVDLRVETLVSASLLVPASMLGTALGLRSARNLLGGAFRRLILGLVFATGAFSTVAGVMEGLSR